MSIRLVCSEILKYQPKFQGVSGDYTQDMKNIFNVAMCLQVFLVI